MRIKRFLSGFIGAQLLIFGFSGQAQNMDAMRAAAGDGSVAVDEPAPLEPALLEKALDEGAGLDLVTRGVIAGGHSLAKFADVLNIRPKAFQTDGDDTSLGISWEYEKSLKQHEFDGAALDHYGLDLGISSLGNVAFEDDVNPRDFLKADVSFAFFLSEGGIAKGVPEVTDDIANARFEQATLAARAASPAEITKASRAIVDGIRDVMSTQYYVEAAFDVGYETDQSFDNQQWTMGGHFGLDVKAWNPNAALAKFNFLDYPFAFTRWLSGTDSSFRPSGAALPTFLVGIDQVTPTEADMVRMGDTSSFVRARAEASHRSLVADVGGESIIFETNIRYYNELDPSAAIRAAGRDDSFLFTAALLLPKNTFISYSTGDLPFDLADERVFAVGFNYNF